MNEAKTEVKGEKLKYIIIFSVIILIVLATIIGKVLTTNNANTKNMLAKDDLMNITKKFSIYFSSYPSDIRVEYDFINKTKTIVYKDNRNEVEYNRFDELFDFLYDTMFQDNSNIDFSKLDNIGAVYAVPKAYYGMMVYFDTTEEVAIKSKNWWSYVDTRNNYSIASLAGYKFPSYWKKMLKILEIDESILVDGATYNFNQSSY